MSRFKIDRKDVAKLGIPPPEFSEQVSPKRQKFPEVGFWL